MDELVVADSLLTGNMMTSNPSPNTGWACSFARSLAGFSRAKSLATVLLSTAIAELILVGPLLQKLVSGILNGDSATIYTAAWGQTVIQYPSLAQWFLVHSRRSRWARA
ncbi:hypothetical protein U8P71_14970 [Rhizobium ruizarguesonis]|nr:hypothetical protein U8P71_14970 [Rhizobium ruizarguesonis]